VEQGLINEDTIKVGSIERAHVFHLERATVSDKFGVTPGDRHIIEKDVSLRVPTRNRGVLVEKKPSSHVGAFAHDQQR
jgi:hypothetical protein